MVRFLPVNLSSFLVELADLNETLALFDSLSEQPLYGIEEVIPAARTLLIRFQPVAVSATVLAVQISQRERVRVPSASPQQVTVPVYYNGEDLNDVAEHLGIRVSDVIARHTDALWSVAFTGFAPGFAYMVSHDSSWQVPRRRTPRTRIPAGSVALAGEFSGIYPQASPGGWQLIGHTPLKMWDLHRQQPALLLPGTQVRFVDATSETAVISLPPVTSVSEEHTDVTPTNLTVLSSGLQALYQDLGRPGQAAMGVGESGAMDKAALRNANRIVGNPVTHTCLEIVQGGFRARVQGELLLCVTGAPCEITLKTASGDTVTMACYQPLDLCDGDEIFLRGAATGLRSYVAVRGGFLVDAVLGSCAFDSLAQVGPLPLKTGDVLNIGGTEGCTAVQCEVLPPVSLPMSGDIVTLDIVFGPRTDWFTAEAIALLTSQDWLVTPQSNRIGLRLSGGQTLTRSQHQELPSEGTCCGAIQVPASGQPVLFLNDHPLTGGYPVIAAVAEYHLDLAGQIPPGAFIRFNAVRPFHDINESEIFDEHRF